MCQGKDHSAALFSLTTFPEAAADPDDASLHRAYMGSCIRRVAPPELAADSEQAVQGQYLLRGAAAYCSRKQGSQKHVGFQLVEDYKLRGRKLSFEGHGPRAAAGLSPTPSAALQPIAAVQGVRIKGSLGQSCGHRLSLASPCRVHGNMSDQCHDRAALGTQTATLLRRSPPSAQQL